MIFVFVASTVNYLNGRCLMMFAQTQTSLKRFIFSTSIDEQQPNAKSQDVQWKHLLLNIISIYIKFANSLSASSLSLPLVTSKVFDVELYGTATRYSHQLYMSHVSFLANKIVCSMYAPDLHSVHSKCNQLFYYEFYAP